MYRERWSGSKEGITFAKSEEVVGEAENRHSRRVLRRKTASRTGMTCRGRRCRSVMAADEGGVVWSGMEETVRDGGGRRRAGRGWLHSMDERRLPALKVQSAMATACGG